MSAFLRGPGGAGGAARAARGPAGPPAPRSVLRCPLSRAPWRLRRAAGAGRGVRGDTGWRPAAGSGRSAPLRAGLGWAGEGRCPPPVCPSCLEAPQSCLVLRGNGRGPASAVGAFHTSGLCSLPGGDRCLQACEGHPPRGVLGAAQVSVLRDLLESGQPARGGPSRAEGLEKLDLQRSLPAAAILCPQASGGHCPQHQKSTAFRRMSRQEPCPRFHQGLFLQIRKLQESNELK
ncbi:uncharacterized protein LOC127380793 [Apus apus]|uniref:uncharacterized protein LOC127380793 n=1 Tax=Apus apus TaxID=8895 RepID=UPI0021F8D2B6|nr:uncharacterized protein LOC127380793 [Apus apus]